ncbi:hypothetical protein, partial [Nocardia abscessus]|uniref:hypothetical protein n=1 Tax=Nocardia abscessus TaxID=120957 RepID=UPI002457390E
MASNLTAPRPRRATRKPLLHSAGGSAGSPNERWGGGGGGGGARRRGGGFVWGGRGGGEEAGRTAAEESELLSATGQDHDQELFLAGQTSPVINASAMQNIGVRQQLV